MFGWQVAHAEFVLLWMTFLAIIYTDLETGIAAGVIFSVFYFAYCYSVVCILHIYDQLTVAVRSG